VSRLQAGRTGLDSPKEQRFFYSPPRPTDSGAYPVSCPIGTGGSFAGSKAAGTWSWPLTSL